MTTKQVRDYLPLLALLHSKKVKSNVKKALLSCPALQDVLCLVALNILKGRVPLSPSQKAKLKKYKKTLLKLSTKGCARKTKQRLLVKSQTGGFLGGLLAPLIGLAAPLLGSIFNAAK